jgi:hypothetical protein
MNKIVGTLRRDRPRLLNRFFDWGEISIGSVEGLKDKAKLVLKKAYGFKS